MKPSDALVDCPMCGEPQAAYKLPINETKFSYWCWGCGFQTNDLMKEGDYDVEAYEETLPELYKDIKKIDPEGRVWYPISINLETKGTVFANGNSKDNWQWSAIQTVELTEEELKDPKYKGKAFKSDAKSLKHFGTDFIEACSHIGIFNQD